MGWGQGLWEMHAQGLQQERKKLKVLSEGSNALSGGLQQRSRSQRGRVGVEPGTHPVLCTDHRGRM